MTKLLLGTMALGVWTLVLLLISARGTLRDLHAEVTAIGIDTERIHEDLDAGEIDESDAAGRSWRRAPIRSGATRRFGA
ncbi:hypothetical protein, partial [Vibrio parahaemolyticus]|uniref:hypothetical protein n=1 Tax=Vibrio parahaemolyticus TaxID=670 RepID=UPI00301D050F